MRLALGVINPTIGDLAGNAAMMAARIEEARAAGAEVVVFPELAVCGYPPRDLLMQEGFVAACAAAAKELGEERTAGITCIFGCPLPARRGDTKEETHSAEHCAAVGSKPRGVHNSLLVYRDNAFVERYDKRLLPTYDVFDEDRYFEPGARAVVVDVPTKSGAVRVGLTICEDLWRGEDAGFASRYHDAADPVAAVVALGAQLIVSPSASPFVMGKGVKHREIIRGHAMKHRVPFASLNQLGGNDDLVFDGHGFVYGAEGELIAAAPGFREELLVVDLAEGGGASRQPHPRPLPPGGRGEACILLESDERQVFEALVLGIRDYLGKTGFKSAIIGLSGGIDSALTAVLAVAALGPENVVGISLPSHYSSEHSKTDAYDLARRLKIQCPTVSIEPPLAGFRAAVDPALREQGRSTLGEKLPDLTEENLQSRIRGTTLMTFSNRTGAMVLTTGNKSELAVGYCTLYGDTNGGLAVLSDVSKQLVYRLSRWINANFTVCGFDEPPIPEGSITKPPSAELRPNQTDQDSLPPYEVLDQIVERSIEGRQSVARIVKETGIDEATVRRVARLIETAEYKRKQTAVGLKMTTVAFGSGRRFPIAQRWRPA